MTRMEPLVDESPQARWLFSSTGLAPVVWLVVRLYLGYEWLHAGWGKITSDKWMHGGVALKGFAAGAIQQSAGSDHPQVAYGWYVSFLEWIRDSAHPWMGPMIAVGEVLIGIGLIVGAFVGIAAFFGIVLNFSFVFAGSAGVNPLFLILGLFLILAWRNAGYIGLDRFLLPAVGTPWVRPRRRIPAEPTPVAT